MTSVVMEEIPGKVTLAISISNCRGNCPGCHSPELRDNIGIPLTPSVIDDLLEKNFGVNCVLFLGEGDDIETLLDLAVYAGNHRAVALYSGKTEVDKPTTNQRLYEIRRHGKGKYEKIDITREFWR